MKLSAKTKVIIEHYLYGLFIAVVANVVKTLTTKGAHNYTTVFWSVVEGVLLPIVIKANPKSLYNKVAKTTGLPESVVANVGAKAINEVVDTVEKEASTVAPDQTK